MIHLLSKRITSFVNIQNICLLLWSTINKIITKKVKMSNHIIGNLYGKELPNNSKMLSLKIFKIDRYLLRGLYNYILCHCNENQLDISKQYVHFLIKKNRLIV